jgi:hypothetical protein
MPSGAPSSESRNERMCKSETAFDFTHPPNMNHMRHTLPKMILATAAISFSLPILGQNAAPPSVAEAQKESAPANAPTGEAGAKGQAIPEDFKPLDEESKKLADSVDQALAMVEKAVTDKNKEDLQKGLDELISRIQGSVTKIETELEPEGRKAMERAQAAAREHTSKAGTPGLSPEQQKRWASLAQTYTNGAQTGVDIIKKMQDTRVDLMTNLKSAENEKDLIIAEIAAKGFAATIISLQTVVDNMANVSLRIRGMVGTVGQSGGRSTN